MPARFCWWDIESTNLNADFGYILCVGMWFSDEDKPRVLSITDFPRAFKRNPVNDSLLVKAAAEELSRADVWVTHYGSRFDVPMMNTRLLAAGYASMPPIPHVDTWRIARYRLKIHSNRLASVAELFGLSEKTALKGPTWVKAMSGHKPSIKYIEEHCRQDVVVLRQVYEKIQSLAPNPPNVNLVDKIARACPRCGADNLQARGLTLARTSVRQRYFCKACRGWSSGPAIKSSIKIR